MTNFSMSYNNVDCYDGAYGGIYCDRYSNSTLINGVIDWNNSWANHEFYGGILYFETNDAAQLQNCTMSSNTVTNQGSFGGLYGAAVYVYATDAVIQDCTIADNLGRNNAASKDAYGGAVCIESCDPTLTGCTLSNNVLYSATETVYGAGIYIMSLSSPSIESCTISYNNAYSGGANADGGGIYCILSTPMFEGCVIANNVGGNGGGFCLVNLSNASIVNCTIDGNTAVDGGAFWLNTTSMVFANNSIIWNNMASGTAHEVFIANAGSSVIMSFSDYDDTAGDWNGTGTLDYSDNCINTDPLYEASSFELSAGSPCLDLGSNVYVVLATDRNGNTRIVDSGGGLIVDMGAYERQP
jgi:hypothetical protein